MESVPRPVPSPTAFRPPCTACHHRLFRSRPALTAISTSALSALSSRDLLPTRQPTTFPPLVSPSALHSCPALRSPPACRLHTAPPPSAPFVPAAPRKKIRTPRKRDMRIHIIYRYVPTACRSGRRRTGKGNSLPEGTHPPRPASTPLPSIRGNRYPPRRDAPPA